MTAVSLFSGMGGDSLAIKNCGIDLVAYSEINAKFRETHNLKCKFLYISRISPQATSSKFILFLEPRCFPQNIFLEMRVKMPNL